MILATVRNRSGRPSMIACPRVPAAQPHGSLCRGGEPDVVSASPGRTGRDFDVVVIGGGVLGTAVACRLSCTTASVCLLEAETDVCEGASKGNAGTAVSYYGPPGTLETDLINRSCPGWEALCERLDVPYRRIGAV